ncbi:uncharacterized protein [Mytilus edulis]|uniref:Uncharacterized protein n=1 Tax=Mytilus edulis TaxID=6550 RepID=A0A8S3UUT0_MYTED|nr:unnamed protein product [Mytilus edulis]
MWKIDAGVLKIGGKQAVDENGKKYPKVKSVKGSKFVYLIYFIGQKKGLKLGKDKYTGSIEVIKKFQAKPSRKITKEKENRLPAVTHIEPSFGKSVEDDKLIGEFTVDAQTLSSPPQEYLCRTVREDWVVEIRNKIREQAAIPQGTHLPVLVDPSQCSDPEKFRGQLLESNSEIKSTDFTLYLLGGNHLVAAIKGLQEEGIKGIGELDVSVYVGLTPEEARLLGNRHNFQMSTLPVTLQQKVEQARLYFKAGSKGKDLVEQIRKINMQTDINKTNLTEDSCSTIKSMASYSERCYICFISLVKRFEAKQGCHKNIPQKLFRALQGLSEEATFSYLSLAAEEGLEKTAGTVDRIKARKSLQTFLCQTVKINTWEEAYKTYPEVSSKIEELVEKKIRRKFVPEVFTAYCNSLTTIPVTVCNNGEESQVSAPEQVDIDEAAAADTQPPAPESSTQNFQIDIFIKSKGKEIVITEEAQRVIDFHKSILDKALTKVLPLEE